MIEFEVKPKLSKILSKLKKKNLKEFNVVMNKILEIADSDFQTINRYKNLKKPLNKFKRVHLNNSFVLLFRYDEAKGCVVFVDYSHHDKAYF